MIRLELHKALAVTSAQLDQAMLDGNRARVEALQQRLEFLADALGAKREEVRIEDLKA